MAQAETIPNTRRNGFLSAGEAGDIAKPTDPIFAILERCQVAYKELDTAVLACDEDDATDADRERLDAVEDELIGARDLLASTVPTTKAGLAAAVEWIMEYERGSIPKTSVRFLRTLAGMAMTSEDDERLDEPGANPEDELTEADNLTLAIIAAYRNADQETKDNVLGILRGTIDVATTITVLR